MHGRSNEDDLISVVLKHRRIDSLTKYKIRKLQSIYQLAIWTYFNWNTWRHLYPFTLEPSQNAIKSTIIVIVTRSTLRF